MPDTRSYDLLHPTWVAVQALRDRDFQVTAPNAWLREVVFAGCCVVWMWMLQCSNARLCQSGVAVGCARLLLAAAGWKPLFGKLAHIMH